MPDNNITISNRVMPVSPRGMEEYWRMATAISKSGLAPKGIEKPEAIFTAMQLGAEVGLSPMQALQNIAVVNGRPTIWGDAQLALVRGSGLLESFSETFDDEKMVATCTLRRKGDKSDIVSTFSREDAKLAGLWDKTGPWKQYPRRMLKLRARAFALRDGFPDILKGVYSTEEARDGAVIDVTPPTTISSAEDLNKEFLSVDDTGEVITPEPQQTDIERDVSDKNSLLIEDAKACINRVNECDEITKEIEDDAKRYVKLMRDLDQTELAVELHQTFINKKKELQLNIGD